MLDFEMQSKGEGEPIENAIDNDKHDYACQLFSAIYFLWLIKSLYETREVTRLLITVAHKLHICG